MIVMFALTLTRSAILQEVVAGIRDKTISSLLTAFNIEQCITGVCNAPP
jgi:hypothetical protein